MNEEFYCVLKLVSGEEIVSEIFIDEADEKPIIVLQSPLKVETIHRGPTGFMRLVPWMSVPDDEIYFIGLDKVITMTEIPANHEMVEAYHHYNQQKDFYSEGEKKVRVSKKMGYIGNVEEARTTLENIFNQTDTVTGIATHA